MGIKFSQKSIEKSTDNFLLEGPELVDAEQEKKEENNLCFTFSSNNREYYLKNKNGQTIFSVKCYDDLPDELTDEERSRFIKEKEIINGKGRDVYILESDKTLKHNKEKKNKTEQNKEYHVSKPRDFQKNVFERFVSNISNRQVMSDILSKYSNLEDNKITELTQKIFNAYKIEDLDTIKTIFDQFSKNTFKKIKNDIYEQNKTSPEEINIPKVVELLKNKKVLFYTGAGMSISGGVPGMEDLHNNLEIDMSKKIDGFLKNSINNPKKVIKDWQEFIDSCFDTQDTDAHKSLAYLAKKLKSRIFTENIDHLQEKAGIKTDHISGPWLRKNIQEDWLKQIDAVITIGLSYDDRGFLAWYKKNNPDGKIISIDLNQSSYLGNEDALLKGNLQEVMPQIEEKFR